MARTSSYAKGRREGRERAIELAYEAQIRGIGVDDLLATLPIAPLAFTETLLRSSERHQNRAEELIKARAKGWSIQRMAAIDLVIMRVAIAELLDRTAPPGAVLAEAVDLATRYSTEESGRFVNGILAAVNRDLEAAE